MGQKGSRSVKKGQEESIRFKKVSKVSRLYLCMYIFPLSKSYYNFSLNLKGNCGGGGKFTWMVVDIIPEFPHIQFLEKLCFYVLIILPN